MTVDRSRPGKELDTSAGGRASATLGGGFASPAVDAVIQPAEVVALEGRAHATLLARLAAAGTGGERTYDALIAEQAAMAGASVLLTLNPRHFETPPRGVTVIEPR